MPAPNKEERGRCWAAKDKYFSCMDTNNDEKSKCADLRKAFEDSCTKTWLKYFDRRRDYLKFKAKVDSGYEPVAEENKT